MADLSIFKNIAENNSWGSAESVSGPGSTLEATAVLRGRLVDAFKQLNIRSLVDAPCGDMNWMRHLNYPFEKYIGIDIVPAIIDRLKTENFSPAYHFQVGNIGTDILPQADAIFCRDCLVHLPFALGVEALRLWKLAGFKYLFATTFPAWGENTDCAPGDWRALNMQNAPFNLAAPVMVISEDVGLAPPYHDKSIGIWAL